MNFSLDQRGAPSITLFIYVRMLCETYIILWNISHVHVECEECFTKYCQSYRTLFVDLNNVMRDCLGNKESSKPRWLIFLLPYQYESFLTISSWYHTTFDRLYLVVTLKWSLGQRAPQTITHTDSKTNWTRKTVEPWGSVLSYERPNL